MGHAPVICAAGVRRTGAWGSPLADSDVDSSRVAPSAPIGASPSRRPTGCSTNQKHPIEPCPGPTGIPRKSSARLGVGRKARGGAVVW